MSRTGCFMGDGLCQLLHCHPSQGPPLSLCFNYLFYHKHGLTLSKPFTDFFSFTTTHKVFLWLFRHICCHSAKKEKKRKICYQAFSGKLCTSQFLCVCVLHGQNSDYTTGQVFDLSEKLEQSEAQLGRGCFMLGLDTHDRKSEDKLAKATRDRWVLFSIECFSKIKCQLNLFWAL